MKNVVTDEMRYKIAKILIIDLLSQKLLTVNEFNQILSKLAKIYDIVDK